MACVYVVRYTNGRIAWASEKLEAVAWTSSYLGPSVPRLFFAHRFPASRATRRDRDCRTHAVSLPVTTIVRVPRVDCDNICDVAQSILEGLCFVT